MSTETMKRDTRSQQVESNESSARPTLAAEFRAYLLQTRNWWMLPIMVVVLVFSALFLLLTAVPVAAPFIYSLF